MLGNTSMAHRLYSSIFALTNSGNLSRYQHCRKLFLNRRLKQLANPSVTFTLSRQDSKSIPLCLQTSAPQVVLLKSLSLKLSGKAGPMLPKEIFLGKPSHVSSFQALYSFSVFTATYFEIPTLPPNTSYIMVLQLNTFNVMH